MNNMKKLVTAIALVSPLVLSGCGNAKHEAAISAIKSQMYDPESLQVNEIENVSVCQQFLPEGYEYNLVRMDINGKNRMGGYTGEKTVFYNPQKGKLVTEETWAVSIAGIKDIDPETENSMYEIARRTCESIVDA